MKHSVILSQLVIFTGTLLLDTYTVAQLPNAPSISTKQETVQDKQGKLKPAKDPVRSQIHAFVSETRQSYNNRRFDELEKKATEIRSRKTLFGDGSWKIVHFYESLECREDEPESMWELHDRIHKDWIAGKPQSVTARVAYVDFLVSYAWHARGSDWAHKVTKTGWTLFKERLSAARTVLGEALALEEKDPFAWSVASRIALGEEWPKANFDALVEDAHKREPTFYKYEIQRAYSLLPRWYGKEGDWEIYAELASVRQDGLGAETYARIVINLSQFYDNIFKDTKAIWPKTKEGLAQMREKYPDSIEIISATAMLASLSKDQALANEMFTKLDGAYSNTIWRDQNQFIAAWNWAETGK